MNVQLQPMTSTGTPLTLSLRKFAEDPIYNGLITRDHLSEIGAQISAEAPSNAKVTIACLSGLGVQDLTAVTTFWEKLCREAAKKTAASGMPDTG